MSERVSEGLSVQAIHGVPADRLPDWVPLMVDGRELPPQSGETFPTLNPATGRELAPLARAQAAHVARAVAAARRAYEEVWSRVSSAERGRILARIAEASAARAEELAVLETLDTGKAISQARTDVRVAARYFEYYAGAADKEIGRASCRERV